jgi:hypothetical protein
MAFPLYVNVKLRKTHWLAGYVAVQHFAWSVMNVMVFQVGLRELYVGVKRASL